jgi:hypothetical protein
MANEFGSAPPAALRYRLKDRREGLRVEVGIGAARVHLATGEYVDGSLGEIFLDHQREGTFGRAMMHAFAVAVSLGLQHGIPLVTFCHAFRDFKTEPDIIRGIFAELEREYHVESSSINEGPTVKLSM